MAVTEIPATATPTPKTVGGAKKDLDSITLATKTVDVTDTPRGACVQISYFSPTLTSKPPFIHPEYKGSIFSCPGSATEVTKTGIDGYACIDFNNDSKFDMCSRTNSEGNQVFENKNGQYVLRESLLMENYTDLRHKLIDGTIDNDTEKYRTK
jgi:hypothetical protein